MLDQWMLDQLMLDQWMLNDDNVGLHVLGCRFDILGTNCDRTLNFVCVQVIV